MVVAVIEEEEETISQKIYPEKSTDASILKSNLVEKKPNKRPGIVYLSRIPPSMSPQEVRRYLEPFGKIGRIYLAPDDKTLKLGRAKSNDPRELRRARFTEGWVEFLHYKNAKTAALALNGYIMGGKKSNRFHDDLWNIKYLKDFLWSNLSEQVAYDRAVRQQRLRTEVSQARKANSQYVQKYERSRELEKIEEAREVKRAKATGTEPVLKSRKAIISEQMTALRSSFKQRKPIVKTEEDV